MPHDLILSFKHQWKLKELALFPQVKELLMDKEAAQYFVKLHIIAGQMNTERMNNTDTFYTLTGKSGEIFNGNKVRVSLIFASRTKESTEPVPTANSFCGWAPEVYKELLSLLLVCQSTSLWGQKQRAAPGRIGQERTVVERGYKVLDFALVWIRLQENIIRVPAGRRSFAVNLFPGSSSTKPAGHPSCKRKWIVCFRLLEFIHLLQT